MENNSSYQAPRDPRQFPERRRRKDWVSRCITFFAVIGWGCAFVAFTYGNRAKPGFDSVVLRALGGTVRQYWDIDMLNLSFRVLLITLFICVLGFLINMSRYRRKSDRINKPLLVLAIITFVAIIVFFIVNRDILILPF